MCRNAKLACGGYEKNIFFDFENTADTGSARFRRPLFTEEERQCMSELLTSSISPRLALWNIAQIDDECEQTPPFQEVQVNRGPFGAFRLSQRQPSLPCDTPSDSSEDSSHSQRVAHVNDETFSLDIALSPSTNELFELLFDQPEQSPASTNPGYWNMAIDTGRIQEVLDTAVIPELSEFSPPSHTWPDNQYSRFATEDIQYGHYMSFSSTFLTQSVHTFVPQDAVFLLKYYAATILSSLTPFRHTKTPWHILFVPHAKHSLAALTLGENLDHASMAAFSGTLAISALSLGNIFQSQMWLERGTAYKQQAREHIRLMLKTAYSIPKVAKYKSILMALLTMVQLSIFSGNRDQTECYFLETEKFIRLRGLNRKKSRKVRLLHHCYTFERLFHESIVVSGGNSTHRHHVRQAVESSGLVVYSLDTLSFNLPTWDNLDEEMNAVKGQEAGENDLHVELPGIWKKTLYPEIFGVPEPWILLLSLVLRLGKEKDAADHEDRSGSFSLKEFLNRAKALERCINQIRRPSQTTNSPENQEPQTYELVLDNMLDATRYALAIYFYRRIYDVDASMLQEKVAKVRDCLFRSNQSEPDVLDSCARFIWPAFVAACEAEDPEMQDSFSTWFKNCAQRSGLHVFTDTLENIERIWRQKRSAKGSGVTWFTLMKNTVQFEQYSLMADAL
jgi:arginine metabolism regulation protein II